MIGAHMTGCGETVRRLALKRLQQAISDGASRVCGAANGRRRRAPEQNSQRWASSAAPLSALTDDGASGVIYGHGSAIKLSAPLALK